MRYSCSDITHLLGNLVKEQGQSESDDPDSSVGDPPAASQPLTQAVAERRLLLLLAAQAPPQEGVVVLQGCRRIRRQEGGEDGVQGDVWDDAAVSSHQEQLLDRGRRGETQRATCQDHG